MNNEYGEGMYCSRKYAEWMLKKNEQDTDYPANSFYKLIRLFSRSNYHGIFLEETRKGNELYYDIVTEGGRIGLKPSYELVFLPYRGKFGKYYGDASAAMQPVHNVLFGYRVLQTRGCMPGSAERVFKYGDFESLAFLVEELKDRAQKWEKLAADHRLEVKDLLEDTCRFYDNALGYSRFANGVKYPVLYLVRDFARAERKGFIDNEWPFSAGPVCPDRLICQLSFMRIANHLMMQADRLDLVPEKDSDDYELRVVAFASAILSFAKEGELTLDDGIALVKVQERAERIFKEYCETVKGNLREICDRIRIGLLWDVTVVIDFTTPDESDCDIFDLEEAPVGVTEKDMESFKALPGHRRSRKRKK